MDTNKTAIVTAIFDIGRDKWENFAMSYHTYLWWMRNLLFLNTNLIIYTEERFKNDILNYRKEVDPNLEKTIIIIQPLESTEGYKTFFEPLKNLMVSDDFKKQIQFEVPEMTQPLYSVVMFAKLFYILDAAKKNLFNADMYVWADAGVLRDDNPEKNITWPDIQKINELENNKVTFFCHHPYVRFDNYRSHSLSQMRYIQGGAVFVPKKCVEDICELFKKTVLDSISKGFIGSDEKIFDFIYSTNINNYNLIQCNWREYFTLFATNKNLEVVISRYNETLDWTKKINYKTTVYNKNQNDTELFACNLPNVGREGHTFFYHIVKNYDNLSEYTAFVQGNPYDHCEDIINEINNFDFKAEFKPLGVIHKLTMEYEGINQEVQLFGQRMGLNITYPIYMTPGGQYIISKRLIQKKPKEFYVNLLDSMAHDVYPQEGLDVEKLLFQIYNIYNP